MPVYHYDVVIVGAGIVGPALAHALSALPPPQNTGKRRRIALLERSLSEPDRIVGELMQPGGIAALRALGLEECLEGIDAIPTYGYCVVESGRKVHIPYPEGHVGRSFHHGRFVMRLREAARKAIGVDVVETTVTDLIEEAGRVVGVRATTRKDIPKTGSDDTGHANGHVTHTATTSSNGMANGKTNDVKDEFRAPLVFCADGCFSNFRNQVLDRSSVKPLNKSNFVGAILEDVTLPIPKHGTVALVKGFGPVLMYQIGEHDTRVLIDVRSPLPSDLKTFILDNIVPQLPSNLHAAIHTAFAKDRLRRMPNSFIPAVKQGLASKPGVILIGDAWNMRHPLTGGGMTVGLNDVVLLRSLFGSLSDWSDWSKIQEILHAWHWKRKPLASTVNILSVALYDLFGAEDERLEVLRAGCFKYFERGGECINGPVSLLAAIAPDPVLLACHFFSVAFYSIRVLFTHPRRVRTKKDEAKPVFKVASLIQWPGLAVLSVQVFWTACVVFGPLVWSEVRWWSPDDSQTRNKVVLRTLTGVALIAGLVWTVVL